MPQKSSITFSPGQKRANSGGLAITSLAANDDPVYDFRAASASGASQVSPASGTSVTSSPDPFGTAPNMENPTIPSGAALAPRLNVAVPGKAPKLRTRQLWEGTVIQLRDTGFVAVLTDKTNPSNPDEQAVFDYDEISSEDRRLIELGASFYWTIGNEITVGGQLKNVSMVQFRRLPLWTQRKLADVRTRARHLEQSVRD